MSDDSQTLFPNTNWSMVARADHLHSSVRRRTLEALLRQYLPALRTYLIARRSVTVERADDLLQSFLVSKVLEQEIIRRADRTRGKFRAFLVTALDRFVIDEFHKAAAAKRAPAEAPASLQMVAEPQHPSREDVDLFDVEWAKQAVGLAVGRMQTECESGGRGDVWGVFEARVLNSVLNDSEPVPYGQLVSRFGFATPEQAANVLTTAKRMFGRNLREVVAEYAEDEADAEDELRRLKRILSNGRA